MEWFGLVFIFFIVTALTALLFGGWVIFTIIRLIFRGLIALVDPSSGTPKQLAVQAGHGVRCGNARCRNFNPATAQFCRRCGAALPTPQPVAVRRAAMW